MDRRECGSLPKSAQLRLVNVFSLSSPEQSVNILCAVFRRRSNTPHHAGAERVTPYKVRMAPPVRMGEEAPAWV